MRHDTVILPVPGVSEPTKLLTFVPDNFPEMGMDKRRPAIIVCPGGGYHFRSDREAEPVALRFMGLGCATFVLEYHYAPIGHYPTPQRQVLAAIDHVRSNCDEYHVNPNAILVMGFSAGGHLAGSAATMWKYPEVLEGLTKEPQAYRPDGVILAYPVITSGPKAHRGSFVNLLGDRYDELLDVTSLEKIVDEDTAPAFLWHTADDKLVPVENTLIMAEAMKSKGVGVEYHIYPHGTHGQSLADETVYSREGMRSMSTGCAIWVEHCMQWIRRNYMPRDL